MFIRRINCILLCIFYFLVEVGADRILLLTDRLTIKNTHSSFIKSIESRGHTVFVKLYGDPSIDLIKYGEFSYDHLILFGPSIDGKQNGPLDTSGILKFIDGGGDVLIAAGSKHNDAIKKIVKEIGFEFDSDKARVIDHHNFDAKLDDGSHTTLTISPSQLIKSSHIVGDKALSPILFRGCALTTESINPLRLIIMTASTSAYSFDPAGPINEYPEAVGKSVTLIGALQARNNARVIVSGSVDLFSDKFFDANLSTGQKSGNMALAESLTKWVFKEVGVLRVSSVNHHVVGQKMPPHEYTIMEDVRYEIGIEELSNKKWQPFKATDVQLEFVRIDPFVRTVLRNSDGKFVAEFKVPDVYGVYKFMVDYHRVGFTHLYDVQQVSVRPLKHTQYERFSRCAYPYYASAYSMMFGVVIFSLVFLYYQQDKTPGQ